MSIKGFNVMCKEIPLSTSILLQEGKPEKAFKMFAEILRQGSEHGFKGYCFSGANSMSLLRDYKALRPVQEHIEFYWLVDKTSTQFRTINPGSLERVVFEISELLTKDKGILFLSVDRLFAKNSDDAVVELVRELNDDISEGKAFVIIISVNPKTLSKETIGGLETEITNIPVEEIKAEETLKKPIEAPEPEVSVVEAKKIEKEEEEKVPAKEPEKKKEEMPKFLLTIDVDTLVDDIRDALKAKVGTVRGRLISKEKAKLEFDARIDRLKRELKSKEIGAEIATEFSSPEEIQLGIVGCSRIQNEFDLFEFVGRILIGEVIVRDADAMSKQLKALKIQKVDSFE